MTLKAAQMLKAALVAIALLVPVLSHAEDAMQGMDTTKSMAKAKSPADRAYMQAMQSMMEATAAMTPTGDADKDFVMMMKPHHQAAVDMAKAYLEYGADPTLTRMAQDIIASQTKEIGEMSGWEKQHGM